MSACQVCASEEPFELRDGKFMCVRCGFEDQNRLEYELAEEWTAPMATPAMIALKMSVQTKKVRSSRRKDDIPTSIQSETAEGSDTVICENDPFKDRNDMLMLYKRVGMRLEAFSKMLGRTMKTLVDDFGATKTAPAVAFAIFRRLLASQGVAFCSRERATNDDLDYEKMLARVPDLIIDEKQAATVKESQLPDSELGFMSILEGALQDKDARTEMSAEENVETTTTTEAEGGTSFDAVVRGGIIPLNLLMLSSIAYLACLVEGSRHITLSNIVRWLREGRLVVHHKQVIDIGHVKVYDNGKMTRMFAMPFRKLLNFHLYEAEAQLQAVMAVTGTPESPCTTKYDELVYRHLTHLNLPRALKRRALQLLHRLDLDSMETSAALARQRTAWSDENRISGSGKGVNPVLGKLNTVPFAYFSTETRALAVVLLLLRLVYGLNDDSSLHTNKECSCGGTFCISSWFRQFRMRVQLISGETVKTVFRNNSSGCPDDYDVTYSLLMERVNVLDTGRHTGRQIDVRRFAYSPFPPNCEPFTPVGFPTDDDPFPEDRVIHTTNADQYRAVNYPLLWHAVEGGRYFKSNRSTLSRFEELNEILIKDFTDESVPGRNNDKFYSMFPCAKGFESLRKPPFAATSILRMDARHAAERYCQIGIGSPDAVAALQMAHTQMGRPLRFLLNGLARMIGEDPSVLYAAVTMLEMRMQKNTTHQEWYDTLLMGNELTLEHCQFRDEVSVEVAMKMFIKPNGDRDPACVQFTQGMTRRRPETEEDHSEVSEDDEDKVMEEVEGVALNESSQEDPDREDDEFDFARGVYDDRTATRYKAENDRLRIATLERVLLPFEFIWSLMSRRLLV